MEYQLYPENIVNMEKLGFKITWTLLNIGLNHDNELLRCFTLSEIRQYISKLLENPENNNDGFINLEIEFFISESDIEMKNILFKLSDLEKVDTKLQEQKLKVYCVKKTIDSLPYDYFQALLELINLWVVLGTPNDYPKTNPNFENIDKYFSIENYKEILEINKLWLKNEIKKIIAEEN